MTSDTPWNDETLDDWMAREKAERDQLVDDLMRDPRYAISDLLARIDRLRTFVLSIAATGYEQDASADAMRRHLDLIRDGCGVAYQYSGDMLHERGGAEAEWDALPFKSRRPRVNEPWPSIAHVTADEWGENPGKPSTTGA